jgi:DNA-binding CsgD family transcriptional regulator
MLKKEDNMRKNDVKPTDDEPVESYRMDPSVVFAIELGDMQSDFSVRLKFLNRNFFVLSEYTREELDAPGFDYLNNLIVRSDHKVILRMIKNLSEHGYLATDAGIFKVLTKSDEAVSVICLFKVIALYPDKSLKGLSGCMMEYDEEMWNIDQLKECLKRRRSPEVMDMINDITCCEMMVLKYTTAGMDEGEIATAMDITIETVRSYRKSLHSKLHCHNNAQMAAFAVRNFLHD